MNSVATKNMIPFTYLVSVTLTALGQASTTLTLQADSSFVLQGFLAVSSKDDPNDPNPNNFSCLITDQSTGRQFASDRLPQALLCGKSENAVLERYSITFPAQAVIKFDFADLSDDNNTVYLALKGYKQLLAA